MTYLSLFFVFGAVQPLNHASPMAISFGKALPWVMARLQPRNIDIRCYDWLNPQLYKIVDFVEATDRLPDRCRHATDSSATCRRTLWVPEATSLGTGGGRRWRKDEKIRSRHRQNWKTMRWQPHECGVANAKYAHRERWPDHAFRTPKGTHGRAGFPGTRLGEEERRK